MSLEQIFSGAGTGVKGIGQIFSGLATARARDFDADMAQFLADRERQLGEEESREFLIERSALRGRQRARMAASGAAVGTGTSLLITEADVRNALRGSQNIRRGRETQARAFESERDLARSAARGARVGTGFRAFSTFLTGGREIFS